MVEKSCSRSHEQPVPGVRSAFMMARSVASWRGSRSAGLVMRDGCFDEGEGDRKVGMSRLILKRFLGPGAPVVFREYFRRSISLFCAPVCPKTASHFSDRCSGLEPHRQSGVEAMVLGVTADLAIVNEAERGVWR